MIDHLLGRPSSGWKRSQIIVTILASVFFLHKSKRRAPIGILHRIDKILQCLPPWKIALVTLLGSYISENLLHLLFLNGPELYAKMYTRNFYRATWIMTSLDAGFFTCMNIRPKWLRDILSPLVSIAYMLFPERADRKVRAFRNKSTIDIIRCSWEKSTNPILYMLTMFDRGFLRIRKDIAIPLPLVPSPSVFLDRPKPHINARIYFDGTLAQLAEATELIFQIPGGGFVSMTPKNHDDYVSNWARQVRVPIVSINYGKAPEFPYPWALEECYEAYRSIIESNGKVLGMSGWDRLDEAGRIVSKNNPIKIVMVGDSAGGNLATGVIFKCLEASHDTVKPPAAFISIYPCLSCDMTCWMTPSELNLVRAESSTSLLPMIDKKLHMRKFAPLEIADAPRAINVLTNRVDRSTSWYHKFLPKMFVHRSAGPSIPSGLSMTSRMSFFSDRIIAPELLRAMALFYLSESPVIADLVHDYYLSPLIAPEELLARFPKTFFIVGEKDPFADDTVLFAARLREAKAKAKTEWERARERRNRRGSFGKNQTGLGLTHLRPLRQSVGGINDMHSSNPDGSDGPRDGSSNDVSENVHDTESTLNFGAESERHIFSYGPDEMVQVKILEGISHAFFQMLTFLPESKQAVRVTSEWFMDIFHDYDARQHEGEMADAAAGFTTVPLVHVMNTSKGTSETTLPKNAVNYSLNGASPGGSAYQCVESQWNFPREKGDRSDISGQMKSTAEGSMVDKRLHEKGLVDATSGKTLQNDPTRIGPGSTGLYLPNSLLALSSSDSRGSTGRSTTRTSVVMEEVAEDAVFAKRRSEMAGILRKKKTLLPSSSHSSS
ncbi:hypothetical protein BSLG_008750 [Batrachochytrium salamandrivorans]|nr:hypothetical protein BASA81_009316 [Batrachochytrium salamandrivorans]KAJ1332448.1 hypothetical protein BSLG_008750 [Batrachochytrium salamandrivorans]